MFLLYKHFTLIKIKSRAGLGHALPTQGSVFSLYHQENKREEAFLIRIRWPDS